MTDRKKLFARNIANVRDSVAAEPTLSRLEAIAEELEEIKRMVTKIESNGKPVEKGELDEIENRLNILEFELFYDSLN
jgi:hypothetical protein